MPKAEFKNRKISCFHFLSLLCFPAGNYEQCVVVGDSLGSLSWHVDDDQGVAGAMAKDA